MRRREFLKGATASTLMCVCGGHAMAQGKFICDFQAPPPPTYGTKTTVRAFGIKPSHPGPDLTWSYDAAKNTVKGETGNLDISNTIAAAFGRWKQAAPKLSFRKVDSGGNIVLSTDALVSKKSGITVLARTAPDGSTIKINKDTVFGLSNAAIKDKNNTLNLLHVLTHEIGHALGLYHSTSEQAVMWASTDATHTRESLYFDDLNAIRVLYGWDKQTGPVFNTETTPALCACGDTLAMLWRGAGPNVNLWISTSTDGINWTPQREFKDAGTIGSPSLAWDGKRLWIICRGVKEDQTLYYRTSTDFFVKDNPPQQRMTDSASSHGPRIAIVGGTPMMACKGRSDDRGIYVAQFLDGKWQPHKLIPNVGTDTSPAICQDADGGARLLWRGPGTDQKLYTTSSSRSSPTSFAPQSVMTWTTPGNGDSDAPVATGTGMSAAASGGPGLAGGGATIHAAWYGPNGDPHLWYTVLTKDLVAGKPTFQWSTPVDIPNALSSDGPSVTIFKDKLVFVWKGKDDKAIYSNRLILEST